MLTLDNLTLRQGSFTLRADLSLTPGRHTALLGPSGAGKSTLLAAIAGFLPPVSGRILWQGRDITPLAPGARPLSILFQDQNLFPHLTLSQNLGLGLRPDLRLSAPQKDAVEAALEQTGLAGLGPRRPSALSGGQQGRAALARALLRARPLLLLDEAFAALGPALKSEMLALTQEVAARAGITLLMITHDPLDARALCPDTILVAEGRAAPPRPTARILDDPPPALKAYLGL